MTERIEKAIFEALDEVNLTLPDGMQLERSAEAVKRDLDLGYISKARAREQYSTLSAIRS